MNTKNIEKANCTIYSMDAKTLLSLSILSVISGAIQDLMRVPWKKQALDYIQNFLTTL